MGLLNKVTGSLFGGNKITGGFNNAIKTQGQMYDTARSDLSPYRELGNNYMKSVNDFMSKPKLTGESVMNRPGYQFRMDEGARTIENSALARGGLNSGNTMKELMEYGQNYATSEYDKELGRENDEFARLMSLLNMGYGAASGSANLATGHGNSMAGLLTGKGQAQAEIAQFPWQLAAKAYGASQGGG